MCYSKPQFKIKAKIWLDTNKGKPAWCTFNHSVYRMQLLQISSAKDLEIRLFELVELFAKAPITLNSISVCIWHAILFTCPTRSGSQSKYAVYKAANETLTTVYSLFAQLLWPIFSRWCLPHQGNFILMTCATQHSVNQLCLFGLGADGFVFNVRIMLSGRCI